MKRKPQNGPIHHQKNSLSHHPPLPYAQTTVVHEPLWSLAVVVLVVAGGGGGKGKKQEADRIKYI